MSTIKKFTSVFKHPCNVNANSPGAEVWRNATPETHPELFGITLWVYDASTDTLYRKQPKHLTGVVHTRTRGGKWEIHNPVCVPGRPVETFEAFATRLQLTAANFKQQPKLGEAK